MLLARGKRSLSVEQQTRIRRRSRRKLKRSRRVSLLPNDDISRLDLALKSRPHGRIDIREECVLNMRRPG